CGDEQIDVLKDPASWLVAQQRPKSTIACYEAGLFPHGFAGRRGDARDDHVANLALGMAADDLNWAGDDVF
ncbi:MAG: hypothetical protein P8J30_01335, partial [Ilumatobacter sp.]|nr:hypothetical protein [Ilumatobacter sp.]